MLSHAFLGNFEVAVLIAGDGDYLPLVEEVQRRGRIVVVAFFEEGMSAGLRLAADYFVDLGERFAHAWRPVLGGGALTGDPRDLRRLASHTPGIEIIKL